MPTNPHSSPTPISTYTITTPPTPYGGNISIFPTSGNVNANGVSFTNAYTFNPVNSGMTVNGPITADDYLMDGQSLKSILDKINERLLILTPDPKKLAKYEALKEAYEHYKLLEKLCSEPDK